MQVVIPSYNRAESIKTARYLEKSNIDYTVYVHNEHQRKSYKRAGKVNGKIVSMDVPLGVTNAKNWLSENLFKENEWYVRLDDNISGFHRVRGGLYHSAKLNVDSPEISQKDYNHPLNAKDLLKLIESDIKVCEKTGARLGGFATTSNYFFNSKKYRQVGYVVGKASFIKHSKLRIDSEMMAMDDYDFTASNLLTFGSVLINGFIKPIAGHYESGGIGSYEKRLPAKRLDCIRLMHNYPKLFRYKKKKNADPKAELQIVPTSVKALNAWRIGMKKQPSN